MPDILIDFVPEKWQHPLRKEKLHIDTDIHTYTHTYTQSDIKYTLGVYQYSQLIEYRSDRNSKHLNIFQ